MLRQTVPAIAAAVLLLAGLSAGGCGPKMQAVTDAISVAKRSHREAIAAGAREHDGDLVMEAEDLIDQAESANRRGDTRQAVFAAELAASKLESAKKQASEAKPADAPGVK